MTGNKPGPDWRIMGKSVQGAAHKRARLLNQDYICWWPEAGTGLPLVVAVSDGHGSAKSFRSFAGAYRAARTSIKVMRDFLDGQSDLANLSSVKRTAEERLPQELVRRWKIEIDKHVACSPLTRQELGALEEREGAAARQAVQDNPLLAYGATLLTVLVTEFFIIYLQLGDGDILTVSETGEVSRPLPRDERLFANETTSLCSPNAWRDFQVGFQALVNVPPALILLCTDGYANSFRDEAAFRQVGSDILEMTRSDGWNTVEGSLEMWLDEASRAGSGDDITLGVVCRMLTVDEPAVQQQTAQDVVAGAKFPSVESLSTGSEQ